MRVIKVKKWGDVMTTIWPKAGSTGRKCKTASPRRGHLSRSLTSKKMPAHLPALISKCWLFPETSLFTSLSLSFLICVAAMVTALPHRVVVRIK